MLAGDSVDEDCRVASDVDPRSGDEILRQTPVVLPSLPLTNLHLSLSSTPSFDPASHKSRICINES